MKILMSGGSGLLGNELLKLDNTIVAPTHQEMDVTTTSVLKMIDIHEPDIFLHLAHYGNPIKCLHNPILAAYTNINGTTNVLNYCRLNNIKLIYMSTAYVFDGLKKEPYKIDDTLNPIGTYALTKASSEFAVKTYENSLIIRGNFCPRPFQYDKALVDQIETKDYVDIIAPMILKWVKSDRTGIVHVGTPEKTLYELAIQTKPNVGKIYLKDIDTYIPPYPNLEITI